MDKSSYHVNSAFGKDKRQRRDNGSSLPVMEWQNQMARRDMRDIGKELYDNNKNLDFQISGDNIY